MKVRRLFTYIKTFRIFLIQQKNSEGFVHLCSVPFIQVRFAFYLFLYHAHQLAQGRLSVIYTHDGT